MIFLRILENEAIIKKLQGKVFILSRRFSQRQAISSDSNSSNNSEHEELTEKFDDTFDELTALLHNISSQSRANSRETKK
jgi:hypothetical protein